MALDSTTIDYGQRAEQAKRFRCLYCSVIMQVLDDTINDVIRWDEPRAVKTFTGWFWSADGREVLGYAGMNRDVRVLSGMLAFIHRGIPTGRALVFDKVA